jgi:hypothetical protein
MDMSPSQRIDLERTKEQVVECKLKAYEQLRSLFIMAELNPKSWTNCGYKDAGHAATKIITQSRKDCEKLITAYEKRWPL